MEYSAEELKALRKVYGGGATDEEFELFLAECRERQLRPGQHVVLQIRTAKEYDPVARAKVTVRKPVFITTINALLLLAQRSGEYEGVDDPVWIYKTDSGFRESPYPEPTPWGAKASVFRKGFKKPLTAMARFDAYAQTFYDYEGKERKLTSMWQQRGPEQDYKCALAAALRTAFPEECGRLYIAEELGKADEAEPVQVDPAVPTQVEPAPEVEVPEVDQTPAKPFVRTVEPIEVIPAAVQSGIVPTKPVTREELEKDYPSPPKESSKKKSGKKAEPKPEAVAAAALNSEVSRKPTKAEFDAYMKKGRQLKTDVLTPGGAEDGGNLLVSYFLAGTGLQKLEELSVQQWEEKWGALGIASEGAEPKDVVEFLRRAA